MTNPTRDQAAGQEPAQAPKARTITFEEACRQYPHRFTMDHVPAWASRPHWIHSPSKAPGQAPRYYAPQYRTDREWYDSTRFPGEPGYIGTEGDCYTTGQTFPLGSWLAEPFNKAAQTYATFEVCVHCGQEWIQTRITGTPRLDAVPCPRCRGLS